MSSTPQAPNGPSDPIDRGSRQAKIQAATPKESNLKAILGILIALLAIGGIAWAIMAGMPDSGSDTKAGTLPRGATSQGGGIMLNATDPGEGVPVVDIYEDFQCPACHLFHGAMGASVDELATSGKAKVIVHMKSFLDAGLKNDYSLKAANVAACASDAGPEQFMKVRDGIMNSAPKPEDEGKGWPDMTFSQLAQDSGITGDAKKTFDKCVADGAHNDYVNAVEEQSARDGITGTPTYRINGEEFDLRKVADPMTGGPREDAGKIFTDAVLAAKK